MGNFVLQLESLVIELEVLSWLICGSQGIILVYAAIYLLDVLILLRHLCRYHAKLCLMTFLYRIIQQWFILSFSVMEDFVLLR